MAKKRTDRKMKRLGKRLELPEIKTALSIADTDPPHPSVLSLAMMDCALSWAETYYELFRIEEAVLVEMNRLGHSSLVRCWAVFKHCELNHLKVYHRKKISIFYETGYDRGGPSGRSACIEIDDPMHAKMVKDNFCKNAYKVSEEICDFYCVVKSAKLDTWRIDQQKSLNDERYGVVGFATVEELASPKKVVPCSTDALESAMKDIADILIDFKQFYGAGNVDRFIEAIEKKGHSRNTVLNALRKHSEEGRIQLAWMNRLELGEYDLTQRTKFGKPLLTLATDLPNEYKNRKFVLICFGTKLNEWWTNGNPQSTVTSIAESSKQDDSPSKEEQEKDTYLNLIVNEAGRTVSRDGAIHAVLNGPLWSAFILLFDAKEVGVPMSVWKNSKKYKYEYSGLRTAIYSLRDKLKNLNVGVTDARKEGCYCLVDLDPKRTSAISDVT